MDLLQGSKSSSLSRCSSRCFCFFFKESDLSTRSSTASLDITEEKKAMIRALGRVALESQRSQDNLAKSVQLEIDEEIVEELTRKQIVKNMKKVYEKSSK